MSGAKQPRWLFGEDLRSPGPGCCGNHCGCGGAPFAAPPARRIPAALFTGQRLAWQCRPRHAGLPPPRPPLSQPRSEEPTAELLSAKQSPSGRGGPEPPVRGWAAGLGRGGAGAGGGSGRHRPGPAAAAAGSRQIRVSWRGLTCGAGPKQRGRATGPLQPARPCQPSAAPPRRTEHGERGSGLGVRSGEPRRGSARLRPGRVGRVSADPSRPSVRPPARRERSGTARGGGGGAGAARGVGRRGNFKPVEVRRRPRCLVHGKVNSRKTGAVPLGVRHRSSVLNRRDTRLS